ncbi:MAG TPA: HNH endonuclease [Candidatus Ornithospirochaeta avicola]|uniref:HNH endonuclease n=1 Tax=Candidatus Ornithospirochaeta avicola TaxID=2840896 RepID=A0A9D1PTR2_9SPIO|nr:HNH endonuclease [Candidatus Ornithospirochaeta avicola]
MKVFVLSRDGRPLMPTTPCRARHLIKAGEAEVVKRTPFTISMLIETSEGIKNVTLGVDAGSKHVGLSASTEKEELFNAEMTLRDDVPQLVTARRQSRRARRSRLRHRKPRFDNRRRPEGWLTPTMEAKVRAHVNVIDDVCSILPVSKIVVETASFDIQKIKNEDIGGKQYQEGEQLGYANVKAYVKARDGFTCQSCGSHEHLEVHHIIQRRDGGSDRPANLITLCEKCHTDHHSGKRPLDIPFPENRGFKSATDMSTMRWFLLDKLNTAHPDIPIEQTYGYITNWNRNKLKLEKTHVNDAFCIAGNFDIDRTDESFRILKLRCHNRQVNKTNKLKGNRWKANQAPRLIGGFCLNDKVMFKGQLCLIHGRRSSGYFDIRKPDGTRVHPSIHYRNIMLVEHTDTRLYYKEEAVHPSAQG